MYVSHVPTFTYSFTHTHFRIILYIRLCILLPPFFFLIIIPRTFGTLFPLPNTWFSWLYFIFHFKVAQLRYPIPYYRTLGCNFFSSITPWWQGCRCIRFCSQSRRDLGAILFWLHSLTKSAVPNLCVQSSALPPASAPTIPTLAI